MDALDIFLLSVRWLHVLSAAAWVGGSMFYLVVLRPAIRRNPDTPRGLTSAAGAEFKTLVDACIIVLIATGAVLAFDRLTEDAVGASYAIALGVKVVLSLWMFLQVRAQRRRSEFLEAFGRAEEASVSGLKRVLRAASGYNALVYLGIVVFLLSDLLGVLFEQGLR